MAVFYDPSRIWGGVNAMIFQARIVGIEGVIFLRILPGTI
jgi:hypothetical protein